VVDLSFPPRCGWRRESCDLSPRLLLCPDGPAALRIPPDLFARALTFPSLASLVGLCVFLVFFVFSFIL